MYLTTADRQFPLSQGAADIGRSSESAVRIDAAGVSRRHARIVITGDEARVEDLGSKNGTFVDAKPVTGACLLKDGDEIRIGPVALTFRIVAPTRATETMRSS
jgi:two-component system response regulator AtoC